MYKDREIQELNIIEEKLFITSQRLTHRQYDYWCTKRRQKLLIIVTILVVIDIFILFGLWKIL